MRKNVVSGPCIAMLREIEKLLGLAQDPSDVPLEQRTVTFRLEPGNGFSDIAVALDEVDSPEPDGVGGALVWKLSGRALHGPTDVVTVDYYPTMESGIGSLSDIAKAQE